MKRRKPRTLFFDHLDDENHQHYRLPLHICMSQQPKRTVQREPISKARFLLVKPLIIMRLYRQESVRIFSKALAFIAVFDMNPLLT